MTLGLILVLVSVQTSADSANITINDSNASNASNASDTGNISVELQTQNATLSNSSESENISDVNSSNKTSFANDTNIISNISETISSINSTDTNSTVNTSIDDLQTETQNEENAIQTITTDPFELFLKQNISYRKVSSEVSLIGSGSARKRIGIVYSSASANQYFSVIAYNQLFMAMQHQAIMAGVPFDVLSEDDLTDYNIVSKYGVLIFPYSANVPAAEVDAISTNLLRAVNETDLGIITAGNFMTNDENGLVLAVPYERSANILSIIPVFFGSNLNVTVKAGDITHPAMRDYSADEEIITFLNSFPAAFDSTGDKTILATEEINNGANITVYNAVLATQNPGGNINIHFASPDLIGSANLVWQAINAILYGDNFALGLKLTRSNSVVTSRTDVDVSQYSDEAPGVESALLSILEEYKNDYDFVGSFYINIGNNVPNNEFTDWSVMGPIYQGFLELGNEIGTHSDTHPDYTDNLTANQLEFEFNQSINIIDSELNISSQGGAIPGNPESFFVQQELNKYLAALSGRFSGVGNGYLSAFGYLTPDFQLIYFSPNIEIDYSLIDFQGKTSAEVSQVWSDEYNTVINHASQPIVHWPWHDYGPVEYNPGYAKEIYTNFINLTYQNRAEFVTQEDVTERLKNFLSSEFNVSGSNPLTAMVSGPGLGTFALTPTSDGEIITSAGNWYAYSENRVFLPENGGIYTVHLGSVQDAVTRIDSLPQRAILISVSGDGENISFSFEGEGDVNIILPSADINVSVNGSDSFARNGTNLILSFDSQGGHSASVSVNSSGIPGSVPIINQISPASNSFVNGSITLRANITGDNITNVTFEIKDNTTAFASGQMFFNSGFYEAMFDTNETYPYNTAVQESINLALTITATDSDNQTINATTIWILDNSPPRINITTPAAQEYSTTFSLNITISDALLAFSNYTITNSTGEIIQQNSTTLNNTIFTWQELVNTTTLPNGNYTLTASAVDFAGNLQTSQAFLASIIWQFLKSLRQ